MSTSNPVDELNFQYLDLPRVQSTGGTNLYVESHGQGPAIVVLNNFFMASPVWRGFTSRLVEHHTVVSYDLRGQGGSTTEEVGNPTWNDHLDDLHAVVGSQGLDRFYLLGTSISAVLCRDYALRHGGSVAGLILAGPALSPWGHRRHRMVIKSWLSTLRGQGMQALFEQMYPMVFGDKMIETVGTPGFLALRESFVVLHTQEQVEASLTVSLECDTRPSILSELEVPTLLMVGDDDFGWSASAIEQMRTLVDDLSVVEIPLAGHLPFLDATERFEHEVAGFVATVEARRCLS
jgi:3-oxoadipate enol-lactonase